MRIGQNMRARKTFLASQVALLTFSLLQVLHRFVPGLNEDVFDFFRGMFLAIAIGAMISWMMQNRNAAR